ncbi:MAG: fused MFS/spermidine synthase [Spirochaetes bacterium]|nr:fused MFS/spermidine synthase [Spirochaetota bacterium]
MYSSRLLAACLCFLLATCASQSPAGAAKKILESENSRYGLVSVHDADGKRYISIGAQEQSGVNLANKREWVYTYMYLLSLGILAAEPGIADRPARVLIIGLGGGSFSDFLAEVYPQWSIDVVEINPAVIRLAKKYFPIDKRVNIIEADGRAFLAKTKNKYDVILMDAFGEHYIPPELYTVEYFTLLKSRLVGGGLTLMNTWEGNPVEAQEIATLRSVFAQGYWIHHPDETPGNRIYILGDKLAAIETLRKSISDDFSRRGFPGASPGKVLAAMRDTASAPKAAPITDRSVRALFRKYGKNWD